MSFKTFKLKGEICDMPIGNPKYKPEYDLVAKNLSALGSTDKKLAQAFGVTVKTIQIWKRDHETFLHSVQEGKDRFDGNLVENALLKRALGYKFDETVKEAGLAEDGTPTLVVTKKTTKQIPPDTMAIRWWLQNRKSKRWSDMNKEDIDKPLPIKIEFVAVNGKVREEESKGGGDE